MAIVFFSDQYNKHKHKRLKNKIIFLQIDDTGPTIAIFRKRCFPNRRSKKRPSFKMIFHDCHDVWLLPLPYSGVKIMAIVSNHGQKLGSSETIFAVGSCLRSMSSFWVGRAETRSENFFPKEYVTDSKMLDRFRHW